jgi:hypothetical protein
VALHCLEAANPTASFLLDWRLDVQRYGLDALDLVGRHVRAPGQVGDTEA